MRGRVGIRVGMDDGKGQMTMAKKNSNGALAVLKDQDEWAAEDDMRTLVRAKEIQPDPKRMEKVKILARKRLESVASVLGEATEKS